jgi:hypothetical protein
MGIRVLSLTGVVEIYAFDLFVAFDYPSCFVAWDFAVGDAFDFVYTFTFEDFDVWGCFGKVPDLILSK